MEEEKLMSRILTRSQMAATSKCSLCSINLDVCHASLTTLLRMSVYIVHDRTAL